MHSKETIHRVQSAFLVAVLATNFFVQHGDAGIPKKTPINAPADLAFADAGLLGIVEQVGRSLRVLDLNHNLIRTIWDAKGKDSYPRAITSDHKKGVYVSDSLGALRHFNLITGSSVTLVEGTGDSLASFDSMVADKDGNLYLSQTYNHTVMLWNEASRHLSIVAGGKPGFAGDGGPAEKALLRFPAGLALTPEGDLLIADTGNYRIRKVDRQSGCITTIAGAGIQPDDEDSRFVGDGGPALNAVFSPGRMTVDKTGAVFIVAGWNRVLRLDPQTSRITTFAGTGKEKSRGDGGLAAHASLAGPAGIAIDSQGNIYVSEYAGNRIRRIDAATGVITTVAGNGLPLRGDLIL